jgi:hypothetical protein
MLRDAAAASLRYYSRLGGLAFALAEAFAPSLSELRPTLRLSSEAPGPATKPDDSGGAPRARTIVIEAAAGQSGLGVFMVENTTDRKVSGPVGVSAFVDAAGRQVQPEVRFSPDVVSLEPGDQVLVQVAAAVDNTLEPGVRYGAEIRIPQLSGATIPLVVRRRGRARTREAESRRE